MTIGPTLSACQGVGTRWAQASPGAASHQGGGGAGLQGSRHCRGAFNQEEGVKEVQTYHEEFSTT